MADEDLAGKHALVTGGGSGIGKACAARLVRDGATVTIMGRTEAKLEAAAHEIGAGRATGRVRIQPGDVADEDAVAEAVAVAGRGSGSGELDVAVGSHGFGMVGSVMRLDRAVWDMAIDVNLTGSYLVLKHTTASMARAGGGSFVAVSSIAADVSHQFMTMYAASKWGLDGLVQSAASELGRFGVRVNSVRPGFVPGTDLTGAIPDADQFIQDCLPQIPLGRLGTVDDIADAVRFLVGPESSWITGVLLPVNGGQHLRRGPDYEQMTRRIFGDAHTDTAPA